MDLIWAAFGLAVIIWALIILTSPPKKHKNFSLTDQNDATHRAQGGSRPLDASDVEPPEIHRRK